METESSSFKDVINHICFEVTIAIINFR